MISDSTWLKILINNFLDNSQTGRIALLRLDAICVP